MVYDFRKFLYSISILVGTIVGVGIFGIPFSFSKAGLVPGFLFLVITGILTLVLNLLYGEIILRTKDYHQFIGYADTYLGHRFRFFISFFWLFSVYSALLAYIIISGDFLSNIFGFELNSFFYSILFFIFVSVSLFIGLRTVAWLELIMSLFFILIVIVISILSFPKINFSNFLAIRSEFWFLPYGVLLFAFAGFNAIPVQKEVISNQIYLLKKSIYIGTLIPAILYAVFGFSVVGVLGDNTTPDAISGLINNLGNKIVLLASIFGVLTITTSFLSLGTSLIETFIFDYKFKKISSWFLTIFIPFILFIFGVRSFIDLISVAGSLAIGIESVFIIFIYMKAKILGDRKPEYSLNISRIFLYIIILLFILGAGYAVVK